MKKIEWATPNRMKFESLHKTFNRQTQIIDTGNIVSRTMIGGYVRAFNDLVLPMGGPCPAGELQDFDLQGFGNNLPSGVREFVHLYGAKQKLLIYVFRHFHKGNKVIDGAIITTTDYKLLRAFYGRTAKQTSIVYEALKYLTEGAA